MVKSALIYGGIGVGIGVIGGIVIALFLKKRKNKKIEFKELKKELKIDKPKKSKAKLKIIIPAAIGVIIIVLIGAYFFGSGIYRPASHKAPLEIVNDLPIWILRGGKVVVYREIELYEDEINFNIKISNLSEEEQTNLIIYEEIHKNIAESASQLEFNVMPQIIEDDPLVMWAVDKIGRKNRITQFEIRRPIPAKDIDIKEFYNTCKIPSGGLTDSERYEKEQAAREQFAADTGMDIAEIHKFCLKRWKNTYAALQEASSQVRMDEAGEKVEKVITNQDDDYEEIRSAFAKATRCPDDPSKSCIDWEAQFIESGLLKPEPTQEPTPPPTPTPSPTPAKSFSFSLDKFPSSLLGVSRSETKAMPVSNSCYENSSPLEYLTAVYRGSNKTIMVAVTKYSNNQQALKVPQNCTNWTVASIPNANFTLNQRGAINTYPFWLTTFSAQGISGRAFSVSVIGEYVVLTTIVTPDGAGGSEADHKSVISTMLNIFK